MRIVTSFLSRGVFAACFLTLLGFSRDAAATTELPLRFGARSLAMGGTGVAYVDDPSAIAINPAGLDGIESFGAMLTFTPFLVSSTVPFSPNRLQTTETEFVPLFFVGAGVRVFEPLVLGGAIYVATGFGAHYTNLPEYGGLDMNVDLAVIEAALPVSYRISRQFQVGAALRFAYAFMSTDMPVDVGSAGGPLRLEQDLTGNAFPGFLVGARYQPDPNLSFGVSYRSELTVDLEGDGTATQAFLGRHPVSIESEWTMPHSFRAGVAWSPLPEELTLALDVSYTLYDGAVEILPMTVTFKDLPDSVVTSEIPFHWKNSLAGHLGAEYAVSEIVALRGGYGLAASATNEAHASPLTPPPGLIHTVHAGVGLNFAPIAVDLGGARAFGGADVSSSTEGPGGRYSGGYWLFGGSVSYRN
jgi:long-chain fatty acid transport protein